MDMLNRIRAFAARSFVLYLWANVPVVAAIGLLLGTDWLIPVAMTSVLAGITTLSWRANAEAAVLTWLALRLVGAFRQAQEAVGEAEEAYRTVERQTAEQRQIEQRAEEEKKETLRHLAADFEGQVKGIVAKVGGAAEEMQDTARSMTAIAAAVEQQSAATQVLGAAEQLSRQSQDLTVQVDQFIGQLRAR